MVVLLVTILLSPNTSNLLSAHEELRFKENPSIHLNNGITSDIQIQIIVLIQSHLRF